MAILYGIDDTKSLGLDGFTSLFFKSWHITKHDILDVVNEFFSDDFYFPPFNITPISLIPKVANASHFKELRPISCCIVVYKIIGKVLTARLQKVIFDILDMQWLSLGSYQEVKLMITCSWLLGPLKDIPEHPSVLGACSRLICLRLMVPLNGRI